mmetsp:Transcript_54011/g.114717  ORF Transcript_54011/g.114717 Transcript_54011/m.114717 type:complete len:350 (+) Transcript_54011:78-1127(+)|eukprot:CAMPEP_0172535222 /NCGR_PEP_ID=MMETSP1067-20121228/7324_1 /TAXON_ID=265564 ORGANISM="Thalassiosira punctigera, Strain Tpunct2005C2" /NCGR_SAMPLE_ID=MMETSP1067 /ASSEMBLY_ACC=CAM_ASM_000444 /LENGTH=349 /DNA_ID=CAMNT_0013320139 /DNA_START=46 /DNA_END=1095 /DNA_ORIENTATION=+
MIQKLGAYAVVATALVVLLSSTARIGLAILSSSVAVDFDVDLDDLDANPNDEPILPINRRKMAVSRGDTGPGGVSDALPGLVQMSSQTRKVDEKNLPYKCGVIMYNHHIPGEGGDALDEWISELAESNDNFSLISSGKQESKESFLKLVEQGIQNIGPSDWKIIYTHRNGLAFDADEEILRSWRDTVQGGNCQFVAAAVFSDPLDHSIKQTKKLFSECQCPMVEFKEKMKDIMDDPWAGQLDSFLFNGYESSMEMKEKVKRGFQLLKDHFEIVMVDGQGDLAEEILRFTGWKSLSKVKKATVSDGGLVYSKDLVSKYNKMSTKNGDADFVDAVNHVYHNSLAYLMLQSQ